MIKIYCKIIKQLKDEIFSLIDEFGNEEVVFNGESLGFKFKTDDNLVCDEKKFSCLCNIIKYCNLRKMDSFSNF